jgi:hypothetical protein
MEYNTFNNLYIYKKSLLKLGYLKYYLEAYGYEI